LAVLSCPVLSCAVLAVLGLGFFGGKELLLALGGGKGKKRKGG